MIETYIEHNILEIEKSKTKKEKKSASKKGKGPKYRPESYHGGDGSFSVDHTKYDPLDEEFFQRNKIPTKNQFNKAKSNLREAN